MLEKETVKFKIIENEGNGECFYLALKHCLKSDEKTETLRKMVVSYAAENMQQKIVQYYSKSSEVNDNDKEKVVKAYAVYMKKANRQSTMVEVEAASALYNFSYTVIIIYYATLSPRNSKIEILEMERNCCAKFQFLITYINGYGHFEVITPTSGKIRMRENYLLIEMDSQNLTLQVNRKRRGVAEESESNVKARRINNEEIGEKHEIFMIPGSNPVYKTQSDLENLAEIAVQARLRERLLNEGIKLWQAPFYDEVSSISNDTEIMALGSRYSTETGISEFDVVGTLLLIQRNAVERLVERDLFRSTGLATLRVKQANQNQKLQVNLSTTGKALKTTVAQIMDLPERRLKLISSGKVIGDDGTLSEQGVKNGGNILVLVIGAEKEDTVEENVFRELEEIKTSADYLAGKDQTGKYSLQVADQSGRALDLPDSEKKALAMSLALHDKGRAAMKEKDYSKALVYLLEADTVYSQCKAAILDMVDNFGLLNLDIAWCYLCLQSITDLPAVEVRLSKCEKALLKSYGENFGRVVALQGSTGAESALFVRLHLLQGIAAFHLGQTEKAKFLISKVNTEISRLQISNEQLAELVNMGYTPAESRTALRATYGDVTAAVDWIINKREEALRIKKQEDEHSQLRNIVTLPVDLGKCTNGNPVSVALFKTLKDMGFDVHLAKEALRRTNNDINLSVELVNDAGFISSCMSAPAPLTSTNAAAVQIQAIAMGNEIANNAAATQLSAEEEMKSLKALETLSKDTCHCPESDYIDLSLSDETAFFTLYKVLLHM